VKLHYQHKDGSPIHFSSILISLGNEKGEVLRLLGIHHLLEEEKHQLNATDLIEGVKSHIVTESTFLKKDGSRISAIQGGGIVRDSNGSPLFFTLEFIDVTDLRQLSAQLKVSEQRFKGIFDTTFQFIRFSECIKHFIRMRMPEE